MNAPKLIGITGLAGVGKDSVAAYLGEDHRFASYSFANPLKQMIAVLLGAETSWGDRVWKEKPIHWLGKSPRQLAQTLGTEWGRDRVHPELWVLLAARHYTEVVAPLMAEGLLAGLVIPDVRFKNEAEFIREHGGQIWHVTRPGVAAVAAHSSEAGIPPEYVDRHIDNSGTFDALRSQVAQYARGRPQLSNTDPGHTHTL